MLKFNDILAVVVSFNGLNKTLLTVKSLMGNVGHILIVDNGSDEESIALLESFDDSSVSVLLLKENKGIGFALNIGVEVARANGYHWLLTMDQDSLIDPGMIKAYQAAIQNNQDLECLTPNIDALGPVEESTYVNYAITSGNLVRVSVFDDVGLYDEQFFIDYVDFEFSLRYRKHGGRIYCVQNAQMKHQLGDISNCQKVSSIFYTSHSPLRRYYMFRNHLYLLERYFLSFPILMTKLTTALLFLFALLIVNDEEPRISYSYIFRGVVHYFLRIRGEIPGRIL